VKNVSFASAELEARSGRLVQLDNKMRYSHNRSDWGGRGAFGGLASGSDRQHPDGHGFPSARHVELLQCRHGHAGGLDEVGASGSVFAPGYFSVTANNLPNQGILANSGLAGNIGAYVGFGNVQKSWSSEFSDQLTLTGDLGNHHLALGGFVGWPN
jgi:hypothetical protein